MSLPTNAPVAGAAQGGVPQGTPAPAGVPAGTPSPAPNNAQPRMVPEADLRKLQSEQDRRFAQYQQQVQAQMAGLQRQLYEAQTRGLPDEQRRAYDAQLVAQQAQELQAQNQQLQAQLQAQTITQQWVNYFAELGVPRERLDSSTPDTLLETGWGYVREKLSGASAPAQDAGNPAPAAGGQTVPASTVPVVPAPTVATQTGAPPAPATFPEVLKQYGLPNQEALYRAVENGQLPPSVIPIPPESAPAA